MQCAWAVGIVEQQRHDGRTIFSPLRCGSALDWSYGSGFPLHILYDWILCPL